MSINGLREYSYYKMQVWKVKKPPQEEEILKTQKKKRAQTEIKQKL